MLPRRVVTLSRQSFGLGFNQLSWLAYSAAGGLLNRIGRSGWKRPEQPSSDLVRSTAFSLSLNSQRGRTPTTEPRVRIRKEANYRKKILRQHKQHATSRGTRRQMHGHDVPSGFSIRQALQHSAKYTNLGRHRIYEAPILTRIRMVESMVQKLEQEIVMLERSLSRARSRLASDKAELLNAFASATAASNVARTSSPSPCISHQLMDAPR